STPAYYPLSLHDALPIFESVFPLVVVFGDIALSVYGLGGLNPSVIADHIISKGLEIGIHPIDIGLPPVLCDWGIGLITIFIGNPVFGSGSPEEKGILLGQDRPSQDRQQKQQTISCTTLL